MVDLRVYVKKTTKAHGVDEVLRLDQSTANVVVDLIGPGVIGDSHVVIVAVDRFSARKRKGLVVVLKSRDDMRQGCLVAFRARNWHSLDYFWVEDDELARKTCDQRLDPSESVKHCWA